MRISESSVVILLLAAGMLLGAPARAADPAEQGDPYVLLDAAKLKLGEGQLAKARAMLAKIPADAAEPYVNEEIIFQQLLINGAYLKATHSLLNELLRFELDDSAYAQWLQSERSAYAAEFTRLAEAFLGSTANGLRMDFIRFRLPVVTVGHLNDLELYSDPEILGPAVTNWQDGREGLGKGLIAGQARVALVLSAARYYDLPQAAASLEQVRKRLTSGVPLDYSAILEWLAEEAAQVPEIAGLAAVKSSTEARLQEIAAGSVGQAALNAAAGSEQNSTEVEPSE